MANIKIEQVEKLREKTGVTYEEAKIALEETNGDLLEAIVNLERQGKINAPSGGGFYSSQTPDPAGSGPKKQNTHNAYDHAPGKFKEMMKRFFVWCGEMIGKGNRNYLDAIKNDNTILSLPITVVVVLFLFAFWVMFPLAIIGLFLGVKYVFRGPEVSRKDVNDAMDKASQKAENLKQEIIQEMEQYERDNPDH